MPTTHSPCHGFPLRIDVFLNVEVRAQPLLKSSLRDSRTARTLYLKLNFISRGTATRSVRQKGEEGVVAHKVFLRTLRRSARWRMVGRPCGQFHGDLRVERLVSTRLICVPTFPSRRQLDSLRIVAHSVRGGGRVSRRVMGTSDALLASDEQVANRNAKLWSGVVTVSETKELRRVMRPRNEAVPRVVPRAKCTTRCLLESAPLRAGCCLLQGRVWHGATEDGP
jgi:hypothetical protein